MSSASVAYGCNGGATPHPNARQQRATDDGDGDGRQMAIPIFLPFSWICADGCCSEDGTSQGSGVVIGHCRTPSARFTGYLAISLWALEIKEELFTLSNNNEELDVTSSGPSTLCTYLTRNMDTHILGSWMI